MPMFLFKNRYKIKYNIKKITYHFSIQERIKFFFLFKRIRKKASKSHLT